MHFSNSLLLQNSVRYIKTSKKQWRNFDKHIPDCSTWVHWARSVTSEKSHEYSFEMSCVRYLLHCSGNSNANLRMHQVIIKSAIVADAYCLDLLGNSNTDWHSKLFRLIDAPVPAHSRYSQFSFQIQFSRLKHSFQAARKLHSLTRQFSDPQLCKSNSRMMKCRVRISIRSIKGARSSVL